MFVILERHDDRLLIQEEGLDEPGAEPIVIDIGPTILSSDNFQVIRKCSVQFEDGSSGNYFVMLDQIQDVGYLPFKKEIFTLYKSLGDE